jgi:hypothetical protein
VVVANGIVSGSGYTPVQPFDLYAFGSGQETAGSPSNTDVLVFHGSTDAPVVDVFESAVLNATAVDDLAYTDFAGYLSLPTADYSIQIRSSDNSTIVAAYSAPLATLGLQGQALVVLASGFLDPSQNSNGEAFGLYVALPSGGALIPLPAAAIPTARIQAIHNSADLAAAEVDVYLNGSLLLDDFAFRTATPFVDVQAGVDLSLAIAPSSSTSVTDAIATFTYNLMENGKYVLIANGIVSGSGYTPALPFNIHVQADAREAASMMGNTDILVFHGCTDAPTVDVGETAVLAGATIVDDLSYSEYAGYLEVATDDYTLELRDASGTPLGLSYLAPLQTLGLDGAAITVLASGFLDPAVNSNGPAFGLWVALATGGPLVPLSLTTGVEENAAIASLNLFPNPADEQITVDVDLNAGGRYDVEIVDMTGRVMSRNSGREFTTGASRLNIPVTQLAPGHYTLRLYGESTSRELSFNVVR